MKSLHTLALCSFLAAGASGCKTADGNSNVKEVANPPLGPLQQSNISQDVAGAAQAVSQAIQVTALDGQQIITADILSQTKCIIALNITRGAFLLGGEGGGGLMACRVASGGWSAPSFMRGGGFDLSAAIGFQSMNLSIFITDAATAVQYQGQGNFDTRGILSAVAANAAIALQNVQQNGLVAVQSDTSGLYAGVGISFTSLSHMQAGRNQVVYAQALGGANGAAGEPVDLNGRPCSDYNLPFRRNICIQNFNARTGSSAGQGLVTASQILVVPADGAPVITKPFNDVLRGIN